MSGYTSDALKVLEGLDPVRQRPNMYPIHQTQIILRKLSTIVSMRFSRVLYHIKVTLHETLVLAWRITAEGCLSIYIHNMVFLV